MTNTIRVRLEITTPHGTHTFETSTDQVPPSESMASVFATIRDHETMLASIFPGEYADFKEGWQ